MKRIAVITAAVLLYAMPSIAANAGEVGPGPAASFEQRKAEVLGRIDQRLVRLQEARVCVSAATTPEALRACLPRPAGPMGQGQGRQRTGQ